MDGQASVGHELTNKIAIRLADTRLAKWSMYALMVYPIIDFGLRLQHIHPLGVVWDKVVMIILALTAAGRFIGGHRPEWLAWHKFAGWFMVFVMALMFAGLATPIVAVQGFRSDIYYILYAFLIPFVVGPEDVKKLFHVGAMTAILIAAHGIFQYIIKVPIPGDWVDAHEHVRTRVFSVLTSPNELGSYMALSIPLVAGMALSETNRARKWLYGIGTLLCVATLMFTFTRGAWLFLLVALFVMAVLFDKRLLLGLAVLVVVGYFLPPIHHRIQDLFSPVYLLKSSQSGGRIDRWMTAFGKMSVNPLFGVGVGRYGGQVAANYHLSIYSDNFYAKTLGESGLVGLTLFITMQLSLMKDIYQKVVKRIGGRDKYMVIGALTGLIAVLLHNSIENVFEFGPMTMTYFAYASLLLVWGLGSTKEGQHEQA